MIYTKEQIKAEIEKIKTENVNDAAIEYAINNKTSNGYILEENIKGFIVGSMWQKEQMFNNAIEGSITSANGVFGYDVAAFKFDDDHKYTILLSHKKGRKYGDKVRIIIVDENNYE